MKYLTKEEIIKELRQRVVNKVSEPKLVRKEIIEATVDELLDFIMEKVWEGKVVRFRGFGKFYLHDGAPRVARNPKTGERVDIPAMKVPKFKAGKDFRSRGGR